MTTLLAQLTDLHIREPGRLAYGRLDTAPFLRQAVASIGRLKQQPDAVVLTGDLTDFGRADEYAHLADLLAPLPMPVYLMPGNHDDRDQLRRSFAAHTYLGTCDYVQYSVSIGEIQLIALDSVEQGKSGGRLCQKRLDWLEMQLHEHAGRPVVIALHHPPFQTLIGHMDRIGLSEGAQALENLIAGHPQVERIICGHLHRTIYARFGRTVVSTAPSTAHQVCLDLDQDAPSAWVMEPPGFHLHAWSGAGRLVTHAAASGQFDGPHPFHDGGALID
jgi:3',5'-cyclic AMP phosphodiesterase CpdA